MGRQEAPDGLMPAGESGGSSVDDPRLPGARHGASAIGQRNGHENLARPSGRKARAIPASGIHEPAGKRYRGAFRA